MTIQASITRLFAPSAKEVVPAVQNYREHFAELNTFYDEATEDYKYWSAKMHMHYGYLIKWHDFFHRERMLDQMCESVAVQLHARSGKHLLDLGCGVGASARFISERYNCRVSGVNIVQSQVDSGRRMTRKEQLTRKVRILLGDYHVLPFPDEMSDGVYAIESFCHAHNKNRVLREAFRVLKPGGRFVIRDCFIKVPEKRMSFTARWTYSLLKKVWHLPELPNIDWMQDQMKEIGYSKVNAKNLRWKVAPSLFHSPYLVIKFAMLSLLKRGFIPRQSRKNLMGVILSIIIGLHAGTFGYFSLSGKK